MLQLCIMQHNVEIYSQWNAIIQAKFCESQMPPFRSVGSELYKLAQTCSSVWWHAAAI